MDQLPRNPQTGRIQSVVVAIGHFGNFELYGRVGLFLPECVSATTYRGIKPEGLDRLLRELRTKSGCHYFERREQGASLRAFMTKQSAILGLLVDQHGGDHGLRLPFLGQDASTNPSAAIFALRYNVPLVTAICYRVALGKWRIEVGPLIPTRNPGGTARSVVEITSDVNRALEAGVVRDPANWFWVHRRWKPASHRGRPRPPVDSILPSDSNG